MLAEKGLWAFWAKTCLKPCVVNLGRRAEVPFAKLRGDVTGLLQAGGDGGFLVEAIESATVGLDTKAALKFADHQACARRHALRRGAVAVLRQHAAAGERIDIGGLDVLHHALDAEVGMAVIVGVDDNDVRLVGGPCDERQCQQGEKHGKVSCSVVHGFFGEWLSALGVAATADLALAGPAPALNRGFALGMTAAVSFR